MLLSVSGAKLPVCGFSLNRDLAKRRKAEVRIASRVVVATSVTEDKKTLIGRDFPPAGWDDDGRDPCAGSE